MDLDFKVRREPAPNTACSVHPTPAVLLQRGSLAGKKIPDQTHSAARCFLEGDEPEENLRALAKRHKELSGSFVNWLAAYEHAEQVWRKGLEFRKG